VDGLAGDAELHLVAVHEADVELAAHRFYDVELREDVVLSAVEDARDEGLIVS
jgi:hypothetical protein